MSACELLLTICAVILCSICARSQSTHSERAFPESKAKIENALKAMQANMAGRLPALEGFAKPGEHALDRYRRAYFQASAEVLLDSSGGSVVRIQAKVTAWYADPDSSHSGYQLLQSNGRLEADLLDQLAEQLAALTPEKSALPAPIVKPAPKASKTEQPAAPEPARRFPSASGTVSSSLTELAVPPAAGPKAPDSSAKADSPLKAEADSLEEILRNTAHPKNLVAVTKSGTPVVSAPSLTAKPQFLASVHDEFELLDFNADWVHVRISGLSRGWIWRNSVEMPDGIPETATASAAAPSAAADLFHVVREETAPFPGDWQALRGKSVKIISVQKVDEAAKSVGLSERLEYAKFLLDKGYSELAGKTQELEGIVVIFDSADGGMIAATAPVLRQWKAGTLTDSALWHQCFFDPPETIESAGSSPAK